MSELKALNLSNLFANPYSVADDINTTKFELTLSGDSHNNFVPLIPLPGSVVFLR